MDKIDSYNVYFYTFSHIMKLLKKRWKFFDCHHMLFNIANHVAEIPIDFTNVSSFTVKIIPS